MTSSASSLSRPGNPGTAAASSLTRSVIAGKSVTTRATTVSTERTSSSSPASSSGVRRRSSSKCMTDSRSTASRAWLTAVMLPSASRVDADDRVHDAADAPAARPDRRADGVDEKREVGRVRLQHRAEGVVAVLVAAGCERVHRARRVAAARRQRPRAEHLGQQRLGGGRVGRELPAGPVQVRACEGLNLLDLTVADAVTGKLDDPVEQLTHLGWRHYSATLSAMAKGRSQAAEAARFPQDGRVRVRRETAGRRGKGATTIYGVPLRDAELKELAGKLKKRCGVGGSVKEGVVELQGDHRDLVVEILRADGYDVVLAGG